MKLVYGVILGLLLYPLMCDICWLIGVYPDFIVLPKYGISDTLLGHCRPIQGENGHGWKFIYREYYQCNEVQNYVSDLIYGGEE